jgi:carbamoyl-phosphate synthase large subunit
MIGATREAIDKAEDRDLFRQAMRRIGLETRAPAIAHSLEEAHPGPGAGRLSAIIRPSFTMGGSGGGIAYNARSSRRSASAASTCRRPASC